MSLCILDGHLAAVEQEPRTRTDLQEAWEETHLFAEARIRPRQTQGSLVLSQEIAQ